MVNRSIETPTAPSDSNTPSSRSTSPPTSETQTSETSVSENTRQTGTPTPRSAERQETTNPRAVFRNPPVALLAVLLLFVCVLPVAGATPWLQPLLLLPVTLAVWIARTRTTATTQGLFVRTFFSSHALPWEDLHGLAITPRSQVRAVLNDGSSLALPTVRTRHVPVLSLISHGRIADPSGVLDEPEE